MRVTVMGLGLFGGGAGAVRYWCESGARVTVTDLRRPEELAESLESLRDCRFEAVLGEHPEELFVDTDLLVVNPAVPPSNPLYRKAVSHGIPVTTELELTLANAPGRILCITGSNGKSTTSGMLHAMVRAAHPGARLAGNIGISILPELRQLAKGTPLVLEVSSFQIEHLSESFRAPDVAIITNLSANHLDRHGDCETYYATKRKLFEGMAGDAAWVGNGTDGNQREWPRFIPAPGISAYLSDPGLPAAGFYRDAGDGAVAVRRTAAGEEALFHASDLRLMGDHNRMNALQAALAARAFGVEAGVIADALRHFQGLPHRMERVAEGSGICWINDSDATTPESTIAGLQSLSGDAVIIAGGVNKGMEFGAMGRAIAERTRACVLIGRDAGQIESAIRAAKREHPVFIAKSLEEAMDCAAANLPRGGTVLFSPACASFDMFRNFAERGDLFRESARRRVGLEPTRR